MQLPIYSQHSSRAILPGVKKCLLLFSSLMLLSLATPVAASLQTRKDRKASRPSADTFVPLPVLSDPPNNTDLEEAITHAVNTAKTVGVEAAVNELADRYKVPRDLARATLVVAGGFNQKKALLVLKPTLRMSVRLKEGGTAEAAINRMLLDAAVILEGLGSRIRNARYAAKEEEGAWRVALDACHSDFEQIELSTGKSASANKRLSAADFVNEVILHQKGYEEDDQQRASTEGRRKDNVGLRAATEQGEASASNRAQPKPTPAEFQPAEKDLGVDIAVVTAVRANLREAPYQSSGVVIEVSQKSILALISREPQDNWLNVVDIASGKEGWINSRLARVMLSRNKKSQDVFKAERYANDGDPQVWVQNNTDKFMNLKIGSKSYQIQSHSGIQITIPAGTHEFYASAAGVIPLFGSKNWQEGHRYSWSFYIKTTRVTK
jgi:hypothetical protein